MKVLGIDTATHLGTVAVVADGRLRAEIAASVRARHGETLLPHVEHVLRLAGLEVSELELVAVGVGPGSFTGVRVGVATAKGLALSVGAPLVGVETPRTMARGVGIGEPIVVPVLDAHRGEVHAAAYRATAESTVEVLAPFRASPTDAARRVREATLDELVLCGEGLRRYEDELRAALGPPHGVAPAVFDTPRAAFLVVEAEHIFATKGPADLATLEPRY